MTTTRTRDPGRLLSPQSIAFVGGRAAEMAIGARRDLAGEGVVIDALVRMADASGTD